METFFVRFKPEPLKEFIENSPWKDCVTIIEFEGSTGIQIRNSERLFSFGVMFGEYLQRNKTEE